MKIVLKTIFVTIIALQMLSCDEYLDVTPDNIATLDNVFNRRNTAEQYLFTCYSYIPSHASVNDNPGFLGADEMWSVPSSSNGNFQIAKGNQGVVEPYTNLWKRMYQGIRICNIFLENIETVPDLTSAEKNRWVSEVKFLKAYYHYTLLRMYGPIVLVKENLLVSDDVETVKVPRSPIDECFDYIIELLDESYKDLPDRIENEVSELGRITKAISISLKAQILVSVASPLFNGNSDYGGFRNKDGTPLFNSVYDEAKWQIAADACKAAIEYCESVGHRLYLYEPRFSQYDLSPTTLTKLSIRNSLTEKWNPEIIWANTNSYVIDLQGKATPRGLDPNLGDNGETRGDMAPPLKIVEKFYSANGVPINEDITYDYEGRFDLETPTAEHKYNLKEGYTTAKLNFNREPRYYASLGFDGGIWYGQGRYDDESDDLLFVSSKMGQPASMIVLHAFSTTGYWPKKFVHFQSIVNPGNTYTTENYPFPVIRLNDLYLLYAEALNEARGPSTEVYEYLDRVRTRAGIPNVERAWSDFSKNPGKVRSKDGLREIIHQERTIELAFEGYRFWDLRRWKTAVNELNKPITGWDLDQEEALGYYREKLIYKQTFIPRDYFWPIEEKAILSNSNLVQNPGW
ncbi:RagB/SusD family nutrient uptake outer membrane protein [Flavivirga eckloniae]|uniref:RagB/SusD family nutrient uptake outer membrane protein n=1 Tax=Flavivirga eckloniae TaxID=1803846 RepID=A0A2K9PMV5_9FLAO|nr:RagB/SusD family nutrient uptake outer membrane protein [Flavivirga eckloniae]AUP77917.1 RagB/SusD family nutrient uptake outer membrane protein [Flavivirga eckloniae]